LTNLNAIHLIGIRKLFACFRCIFKEYFECVQVCPPDIIYKRLFPDLLPMGWDIATGNGWLSASCHGCFPVNPFTGEMTIYDSNKINDYGLFAELDSCLEFCSLNNTLIPEHAPWFPVAIFVDRDSYIRLPRT